MGLIRIDVCDNWTVDYDRERGMYRVSYYRNGELVDECWFDAYEEKECRKPDVNVEHLISERLKRQCDYESCDDCDECCEVAGLMWLYKQLKGDRDED